MVFHRQYREQKTHTDKYGHAEIGQLIAVINTLHRSHTSTLSPTRVALCCLTASYWSVLVIRPNILPSIWSPSILFQHHFCDLLLVGFCDAFDLFLYFWMVGSCMYWHFLYGCIMSKHYLWHIKYIRKKLWFLFVIHIIILKEIETFGKLQKSTC